MIAIFYIIGAAFLGSFLYVGFFITASFIAGTSINDFLWFFLCVASILLSGFCFQAADTMRRGAVQAPLPVSNLVHKTLEAPMRAPGKSNNWLVYIFGILAFGALVLQREYGVFDKFLN